MGGGGDLSSIKLVSFELPKYIVQNVEFFTILLHLVENPRQSSAQKMMQK